MWGSNPFTNYQQTPYSTGSFGNMGQGYGQNPWGGSGEFNPTALNFGSQSPFGMPSYGSQSFGGQGMMGGMMGAPWMNAPWTGGGFNGGGMLGQQPQQNAAMRGPNGMNMPRTDYQTMPYSLGPQGPQNAAPAPGVSQVSSASPVTQSEVNRGVFDSAGMSPQNMPAITRKLTYGY